MSLQNRVDPFSRIHAVSARGLFTGNRGILHDPETKSLKHARWASPSWVICTLAPRKNAQKRPGLMLPGRWTELFFLDEAVGLAAGHRPCHGCRKDAAKAFRDALGLERVSALNDLINSEMKRYLRARSPEPRPSCDPRNLPDGAFFALGGQAFLKWRGAGHAFGFAGYGPAQKLPAEGQRLTPAASCAALRAGYHPQMHPSLECNL
ncbi:MAG: hypothetical protein OIF40_16180 [Mangrovicoccus sp.]|nr:hypothetical protein [Mangrovicoccus sp.]